MSNFNPYVVTAVMVDQSDAAILAHAKYGFAKVSILLDIPLSSTQMGVVESTFNTLSGDAAVLKDLELHREKIVFKSKDTSAAKKFISFVRTHPRESLGVTQQEVVSSAQELADLELELVN